MMLTIRFIAPTVIAPTRAGFTGVASVTDC
jgi:hypothetical protein